MATPGSTLKELNADETALLRALQRWPLSVTRALCAFVAFFADEEPVAAQTRDLHERWRRLGQRDRDLLHSIAVQLNEGMLPPDLQAGLEKRVKDEMRARVVHAEGTRRKGS